LQPSGDPAFDTRPFASETVTVDTTAGGTALTAAKYNPGIGQSPARRAYVTAEGGQMRFFDSGTAPTASAGHLINNGDRIALDGYDTIANFRSIATTATNGTLQVTYER
jgi:hypothetical protein